ncbi:hypothetical protein OG746_35280 [Streptomyces sp. NBC_01016]|uniref:hypothetical protein n=1 Tax=Streptomyces sp. NBC_01016 TaxID=2903720 RepID=UPI0022558AC0|nr:hypothetical protein [Streptomyces sp. NBC_01016]MCX4833999.1 hypothetical protein [Streptomyces sp. NBC_01016]
MSARERPTCGAEGRVPKPIVQNLWEICGRDVSAVVVHCFLIPQHACTEHAGRLLDIGELHWETSA